MADTYITRNELANGPYNLDPDLDPKALEVLQDITRNVIDNLCGKSFAKEGTTDAYVEKKVSGTGKDTIFLPKRLVSFEKIRIYSSSVSSVDYDEDNFEVKEKFISWNLYTPSNESARFAVFNFPLGRYNIGIFGVWGYETVPDPIKYLQGRLIQKMLKEKTFAPKFESEKVGEYNYKILAEAKEMITGDFEFDNIIRQYCDWIGYAVG